VQVHKVINVIIVPSPSAMLTLPVIKSVSGEDRSAFATVFTIMIG